VGLNGKLSVIGGFVEGWTPTDEVHEYDPASDRWQRLTVLPTPRGALAAAVLDGKIHAVGGIGLQGRNTPVLREVLPGVRRFAMLTNSSNPSNVPERKEIQAAARSLALTVDLPEIQRAEDIAPAVEGLKGQVEALYVSPDPVLMANRISINTLANVARMPTISAQREFVEAGGLMSYGPSFADLFRTAAILSTRSCVGRRPPTSQSSSPPNST